jgi:hypothetical protein
MKIMHLVFHPDLTASRVNRTWKRQLENSGKLASSRDLYRDYPDYRIDVELVALGDLRQMRVAKTILS